MKKFLVVLLALMLCLSMVACGGKKIDTDKDDSSAESSVADTIVGKYMILSMSEDGTTFDYNTIVNLGTQDSYIEFKADGSFAMSLFGEDATNGTYDDTAKTLTAEGESVPYTREGDIVTIDMEGAIFKFTKGALPEVSTPVASDPDIGLSDDEDFEESSEDMFESVPVEDVPVESMPEVDDGFVGDYVIQSMCSGGVDFDYESLELLGLEGSYLKINADGTFVMSFNGSVGEGTYDKDTQTLDASSGSVSYEVYGDEIVLSFEDAATSTPIELTFVKGIISDVETPEISTDVSEPVESQPDTSTPVSGASEVAAPGKYMIYSMSMEGMEWDYASLVAMDMGDSYIEIKADGTFTMYLTGEEEVNGTHEEDAKTLTAEDEPISYIAKGDTITLSEQGFEITFTKGELPEAGTDNPDEPVESNGEISVGKYMIYSLESEGVTLNQSTLNSVGLADSYIEFKADGTFVLGLTDEEPITGSYDDSSLTINGESVAYIVNGNKVSLDIEGSEMTFAK